MADLEADIEMQGRSTVVSSTDIDDEEQDSITIELSRDIYSMTVLLIEKNQFKNISCMNKILIGLLVLFSSLTQISFIAALIQDQQETEGYSKTESNVVLYYQPSRTQFFKGLLYEYKGISPPNTDLFTPKDYIIRLAAYGVLLAYLSQSISSIIDYFVFVKFAKCKLLMIFMLLFQITMLASTGAIAANLISNQTDLVDIISVGLGLLILLEVDDYLYNAISSARKGLIHDDELFTIKIYQKCDLLAVKLLMIFCASLGMMIMLIWHIYYFNKLPNDNPDFYYTNFVYEIDAVIAIVFMVIPPVITLSCYCCRGSCKKK